MCTQGPPQRFGEPLPCLPLGGFNSLLLLPCLLFWLSFGLTWAETPTSKKPFPKNSPPSKISRVKKIVLGNRCPRKQLLWWTGFSGKSISVSSPLRWANSEACFSLSPQGPQKNYLPVSLGNNLLNTSWLSFFPFSAHFPYSPTAISWDHLPPSKAESLFHGYNGWIAKKWSQFFISYCIQALTMWLHSSSHQPCGCHSSVECSGRVSVPFLNLGFKKWCALPLSPSQSFTIRHAACWSMRRL